jgi:hypothetical protein
MTNLPREGITIEKTPITSLPIEGRLMEEKTLTSNLPKEGTTREDKAKIMF